MMPRLTAVVTARVTLEAVDMLLLTVLGLLSPVVTSLDTQPVS